jgi:peptidoglycan/LPS O-acetylase OafA/YrhL
LTGTRSKTLGSHVAALDGVRGLAIVMVLFVHFVGNEVPQNRLEGLARKIANYGVWGVDLFFVLSGFLITGILWDAKRGPHFFRNFYIRRTLRIFPLYYGVLSLLFLILPHVPAFYPPALREAAAHQAWIWPYATNFYIARKGSWALTYVSHFWSLAIEEHFYLVWPLVVFLCSRRALIRICCGAIAFSLVLRCVLAFGGVGDIALQVLTPCRLDTLCTGGLLAVLAREGGLDDLAKRARPALLGLGSLVVLVSAWHASTLNVEPLAVPLRGTLIAAFFGALLIRAITAGPNALLTRFFCSRTMRFFGKYSYGLYVFHAIIAYGFEQTQPDLWLTPVMGSHLAAMAVRAVIGTLAAVLVSVVSYEVFEKHFLRLKDRFAPARVDARAT